LTSVFSNIIKAKGLLLPSVEPVSAQGWGTGFPIHVTDLCNWSRIQ